MNTNNQNPVLKAVYLSADSQKPLSKAFSSIQDTSKAEQNINTDFLYPEKPLESFVELSLKSSVLGQCVSSLVSGIYGQDFQLKLRDLRFQDSEGPSIEREKNDVIEKLNSLSVEDSLDFKSLFRAIGEQLERSGNCFIEVLNKDSQPYGIRLIQGEILLTPSEQVYSNYYFYDRDTASWKTVSRPHFFRRYCQRANGVDVWFKSVFDPRIIDSKTGKAYTEEQFSKLSKPEQAKIRPANTLYHFKLNSLNSGYGYPRWANAVNAVITNILIEENNINWFSNGCKSDLIISSTAGLSSVSVEQLKQQIEGSKNIAKSHSTLLLFPDEIAGYSEQAISIDIKELNKNQEGQFLKLYNLNNKLIISACQLSEINVGLTGSYNKASSQSGMQSVEDNTFKPSRELVKSFVNNVLFPLWGVKYHTFSQESVNTVSLEQKAQIISMLKDTGLTLRELRQAGSEIIDVKLTDTQNEFLDYPLALAHAMIQNSMNGQNAPQKANK